MPSLAAPSPYRFRAPPSFRDPNVQNAWKDGGAGAPPKRSQAVQTPRRAVPLSNTRERDVGGAVRTPLKEHGSQRFRQSSIRGVQAQSQHDGAERKRSYAAERRGDGFEVLRDPGPVISAAADCSVGHVVEDHIEQQSIVAGEAEENDDDAEMLENPPHPHDGNAPQTLLNTDHEQLYHQTNAKRRRLSTDSFDSAGLQLQSVSNSAESMQQSSRATNYTTSITIPPPQTPQHSRYTQHHLPSPAPPLFNALPTFTVHAPPTPSQRPTWPIPTSTITTTTTTTPRRPRFLIPTPRNTTSTPTFASTTTNTTHAIPAPLLPAAFSPHHRRKDRFVPGGWASQLRSWVVEASVSSGLDSVTSFRAGMGQRGGAGTAVAVAAEDVCKGGEMVLVNGRVVRAGAEQGQDVNVVLVGDGGAEKGLGQHGRSAGDHVAKGAEIRVGAPAWEVVVARDGGQGHGGGLEGGGGQPRTWVVCPVWKIV